MEKRNYTHVQMLLPGIEAMQSIPWQSCVNSLEYPGAATMPLSIACRPEKDATLAEIIAQQREHSFDTYGYRRMWLWLKSQGISRNPKTVLRVMIRHYALHVKAGKPA